MMTPLSARRIAALALAVCMVAAHATPGHAGNANRGGSIARKNCAPCHAIGTSGASRNPKSPPFRALAERYPLENLQEALAEGITVGHQGEEMPEFRLSPAQIDDLIAYIRRVTPGRPKG